MKLVIKDDGAEARPKWGDLVGCVVVDKNSAYLVCDYSNEIIRLIRVGCLEYRTDPCLDYTIYRNITVADHYKIYRNVTITAEKD